MTLLDVSNGQNAERSFLHTPALSEIVSTPCAPRVSKKHTVRCQVDSDDIRRLQKSLRRRCNEADDINQQLRAANTNISMLANSNYRLIDELKQQKSMVTQREHQVHELQDHVHDLEQQLGDMASYHQDMSADRDQLADELILCQGSLEDVKSESDHWRGQHDMARVQADDVNQKMVEIDKHYVNRMNVWQTRAEEAENMLVKWQRVADGSGWNWHCLICMTALGCVALDCCKSAKICAECFDRIAGSENGCPFCRQDIDASIL